MNKKWVSIIVIALFIFSVFAVKYSPARGAAVEPELIEGNPSCYDLGFPLQFKVDPPSKGTTNYLYEYGTITVTTDGYYADWSSTSGIMAVIVKGGPNLHLYRYYPPADSYGDEGLHSPINPNTGIPHEISHITFCYRPKLVVTKTAETFFTRSYEWDIEKSADQEELLLSPTQKYPVNYEVVVDAVDYIDSGWEVEGVITIHNPSIYTATITAVTDIITGDFSATVDCDFEDFPYDLPSQETVTCAYGPVAVPDATERINTATVTTSGLVGGNFGTAPVIFGEPTDLVDECVDVTDTLYGELGTVCVGEDDLPYPFEYSLWFGLPEDSDVVLECGPNQVTNIASFETIDTAATGKAEWTVDAYVVCDESCTLTAGYWKTHSKYGPAPYDEGWEAIGEDTLFFKTTKSYYEVLWTNPAGGSAYYILAHQYIAAKLNILNGATSTPEVDAAIDYAETFFNNYLPSDPLSKDLRKKVLEYANTLDKYNNGLIGPGHCSASSADIASLSLFSFPAEAINNQLFLPILTGRK